MTQDDNPYPRFWRWRRFGRKAKHSAKRAARAIAHNRFLALVIPWITGSYYLILDIWGDKWAFVANNIELHEKLFCICLVLSLATLFVRGLLKNTPGRFEADDTAREVLGQFINSVGAIVQAKIDRFRTKLLGLKTNSNKFSHITHPQEQLRVIANSVSHFMQSAYNLKEDQVSITVLRRKGDGEWTYIYTQHEWNHTPSRDLMEMKSAARHCLQSGEELFIPDKVKSAREGKFHLTRRDKRRGDGSAYIYPLHYTTPTEPVDCIVSIVTYGAQLCHEYETQTVEITRAFLREFVRRFEVELCLDTIKTGV